MIPFIQKETNKKQNHSQDSTDGCGWARKEKKLRKDIKYVIAEGDLLSLKVHHNQVHCSRDISMRFCMNPGPATTVHYIRNTF